MFYILFTAIGFVFGWLYRKLIFDRLKAHASMTDTLYKESEKRGAILIEDLKSSESIVKDLRKRLNNLRDEDSGKLEAYIHEKISDSSEAEYLENEIKILKEYNLKLQNELIELKKIKTN